MYILHYRPFSYTEFTVHCAMVYLFISFLIIKMDRRVAVSGIDIVVGTNKKTMSKKQIKDFCSKKLTIAFEERSFKIILPRIPPEYYQNERTQNLADNETKKMPSSKKVNC